MAKRGRPPKTTIPLPEPVWEPTTISDAELVAYLDDGPPLGMLTEAAEKDRATRKEDTRRQLGAMPKAYQMIPPGVIPPHDFTLQLSQIERMAYQGMRGDQIAARLGVTPSELMHAAMAYKDVELALSGGAARAADELTAAVMGAGLSGDTASAWKMLGARHGLGAPADSNVTVNVGQVEPPQAVSYDRGAELARRQAEALALDSEPVPVSEGELERESILSQSIEDDGDSKTEDAINENRDA